MLDTELAWDIDAKLLGFLRSQRATLKLGCYCIDVASSKRESLGYIMLDLRAATQGPSPLPELWFPLVNARTHARPASGTIATVFRPELKLSFTVQPRSNVHASTSISTSDPVSVQTMATNTATTTTIGATATSTHPYFPTVHKNLQYHPTTTTTTGTTAATIIGATATTNPINSNPTSIVSSVPVVLQPDGFYQLGKGSLLFTLWITIAFAENLLLLPDNPPSPSNPTNNLGYYFYYSFMGNDIMTSRFYDLQTPSFSAERVSIRFRSSHSDIQLFFRDISKIPVYLCHNDKAIGFADLPISTLLENNSNDTAVIERVLPLYNTREELLYSFDAKPPGIGISMALSQDPVHELQDQDVEAHQRSPEPTQWLHNNTGIPRGMATLDYSEHLIPQRLVVRKSWRDKDTADHNGVPEAPMLSTHSNTTNIDTRHHVPSKNYSVPKVALELPNQDMSPLLQPSNDATIPAGQASKHTPWHQYRFSIELRSLRDIQLKSADVFLKYVYTPFGTSSPILTHPVTQIQRTSGEHLLPHSFCAFEFVMSAERLCTYLEAVPLIVEMWQKDEHARDVLIGNASVNLSLVLASPLRRGGDTRTGAAEMADKADRDQETREEKQLVIQSLDSFVPLMATGDGVVSVGRLADLRVVLALEDFGSVQDSLDSPKDHRVSSMVGVPGYFPSYPTKSHAHHPAAFISDPTTRKPDVDFDPSVPHRVPLTPAERTPLVGRKSPSSDTSTSRNIHDTQEYRVALELELWRRQEETQFTQYLCEREAALMARLAEEWTQRDRDREARLKRKLEEYKHLEAQLELLAADLESRERVVAAGESHLAQRTQDLERDTARELDAARDATRRLQDEFRHRVEIEKSRCVEAESMRAKACRERDQIEAKCKAAEDELAMLKHKASRSEEATVRAELTASVCSKEALEKLLQATRKSKAHYKAELKRVYGLLAKEREKSNRQAELQRAKERKDLEDLRIQTIAKEQLGLVHAERETLEGARRDLDALGRAVYASQTTVGGGRHLGDAGASYLGESIIREGPNASPPKTSLMPMQPEATQHIDRMKKEKESLLSTGFYRVDDELIRELDERISTLMRPAVY
ncbi:hypothetical protein BASA50_003774 [Batrachochytrium salamandrivorans]|uniref:DUF3668 domain-containing protein n=1 Tax=Batrachochytrium salamandrivorans TaxID=1357716 RepID=A0ABQ8FK93_9FUNG|nr:hypothetical protein BASA50_004711 [Batrachochytrium salamandrivorans]KAH6598352.1 hypothetical protein BASA50_003774 [Batrachochytrium salamandrivorans]KAH9273519.1 hypothetical protein BASA83_004187 [Batrachochytrium salamandrivorans]